MYELIKRVLDIVFASICIVITLPISIIIAIVIKVTSKGSVIFKQKRLGRYGKEIVIYKFRTMVDDAENKIDKLSLEQKEEYKNNYRIKHDPRVTKFGKFLRRSKLDELPQLWNIIKGDLSFIGPRPILEEEVKKYGEEKEKFLSVKPGLTGYWQMNQNNCKNYQERMNLELYYVENRNFLLDSFVFLRTISYCTKNLFKLQ